jgi:mRNA interferase MazF
LLVTRAGAIPSLNALTVIPVTTTIRELPSQAVLSEDKGMREDGLVNAEGIQTVAKNKLGSYLTHLHDERMNETFEAISFAFGFAEM